MTFFSPYPMKIFRAFGRFLYRWRYLWLLSFSAALLFYIFCLPKTLFKDPYSFVLLDRKGQFLGARIAQDGQWRFPPTDSLSPKYVRCLLEFEDRRFYSHWGIDIYGFGRAIRDNWQAGKVVSGGSTISMQLMRLSRKRKGRAFSQKIMESILASRLEWSYSKDEILKLYASHAPFGGNVVGIEAAAWRYFGKSAQELSWGEAATLAVLPNSPALIHPGRNRLALKNKRDRLLQTLVKREVLDSLEASLAQKEPIPEAPLPLPQEAPHLLERARQELGDGLQLQSSVDRLLQLQLSALLQRYHRDYRQQEIYNIAALVADIETGEILAYVGNIQDEDQSDAHADDVDLIRAERSTGSILKPFLYAFMLEEGLLSPKSWQSDVPISIKGYRPTNYSGQYMGLVPAGQAIERSLNIPLVLMLQEYGVAKFKQRLRSLGMSSLHRSPQDYGLSLILGGAEGRLDEMLGGFASMARTLKAYEERPYCPYLPDQFRPLSYLPKVANEQPALENCSAQPQLLSAGAIYHCFQNMQRLERPASEGAWEYFESARPLAWKTGTSFGFRDAWAMGVNGKYALGVWVGNAAGEGRPELVGVQTAAPILFDILDLLPADEAETFVLPKTELQPLMVCAHSGYRAKENCIKKERLLLPPSAQSQLPTCPYHQQLVVDSAEQYRLHANCAPLAESKQKSYLMLPPLEAHYYRLRQPLYEPPPAYRPDCLADLPEAPSRMQFIYPKQDLKVFLPIDYDGQRSKLVLKVTHQDNKAKLHWHLDQLYLGSTQDFHEMEVQAAKGQHTIVVMDELGQSIKRNIEILSEGD